MDDARKRRRVECDSQPGPSSAVAAASRPRRFMLQGHKVEAEPPAEPTQEAQEAAVQDDSSPVGMGEAEDPPKKRRGGRKPKAESAVPDTAEEDTGEVQLGAQVPPAKKTRGPRKQKSGETGSLNSAEDASATDEAQMPAKRTRAPRKQRAAASNSDPDEDATTEDQVLAASKSPRAAQEQKAETSSPGDSGEHPTDPPKAQAPVKRPRAPRNQNGETSSPGDSVEDAPVRAPSMKRKAASKTQTEATNASEEPDEAPAPAKRGRGRGKAQPAETAPEESDEAPAKKGRGRGKAQPAETEDQDGEAVDGAPVKKSQARGKAETQTSTASPENAAGELEAPAKKVVRGRGKTKAILEEPKVLEAPEDTASDEAPSKKAGRGRGKTKASPEEAEVLETPEDSAKESDEAPAKKNGRGRGKIKASPEEAEVLQPPRASAPGEAAVQRSSGRGRKAKAKPEVPGGAEAPESGTSPEAPVEASRAEAKQLLPPVPEEAKGPEAPVKKGRGRAKAQPAVAEDTEDSPSEAVDAAPAKRGRPARTKAAPKTADDQGPSSSPVRWCWSCRVRAEAPCVAASHSVERLSLARAQAEDTLRRLDELELETAPRLRFESLLLGIEGEREEAELEVTLASDSLDVADRRALCAFLEGQELFPEDCVLASISRVEAAAEPWAAKLPTRPAGLALRPGAVLLFGDADDPADGEEGSQSSEGGRRDAVRIYFDSAVKPDEARRAKLLGFITSNMKFVAKAKPMGLYALSGPDLRRGNGLVMGISNVRFVGERLYSRLV